MTCIDHRRPQSQSLHGRKRNAADRRGVEMIDHLDDSVFVIVNPQDVIEGREAFGKSYVNHTASGRDDRSLFG